MKNTPKRMPILKDGQVIAETVGYITHGRLIKTELSRALGSSQILTHSEQSYYVGVSSELTFGMGLYRLQVEPGKEVAISPVGNSTAPAKDEAGNPVHLLEFFAQWPEEMRMK